MYQKAYIGQEIKKINCDLTKKTIFLPMKKKEQSTIVDETLDEKNSCQIFREINK
jgi:hypothetical protein